jgi:dTDP-4-amino-4,6-dideoxygalactose transaminase
MGSKNSGKKFSKKDVMKLLFKEQLIIAGFEKAFADFVGKKYAVSVNSGFSALLVALKAAGIGPGDEVIIPDYTFIGTATAVSLAGATPVFIDVMDDATINPDLIIPAITIRTKAIIPVHLYARRSQLERINVIARHYGLVIIEDCAEAIGTKYIGEKGCWSFHYAKTISTEQGGMITTDDKDFAQECRLLSGYYGSDTPYLHSKIGYNFRMTSMQAKMGTVGLNLLPYKLKHMKEVGDMLSKEFGETPQDNYWVFVSKNLKNYDRPGFTPMHMQPCYKTFGKFPVSERLARELKYKFLTV